MDQREREATNTPRRAATTPPHPGGLRGVVFLMLCGLAAAAMAGLMGKAALLHPSGEWIARGLIEQGVNPGLLGLASALAFVGSLVLAAHLRAGRHQTNSAARGEELFERVGGQVVALRRSLHDFRAEVVWLREAMTGLSETVRDHVSQAAAARSAEANKDDAIYRIAASLDQLGARVEGRIQRAESGQFAAMNQLEAQLCAMGERIESALEEARSRAEISGAPATDGYEFSPAWNAHASASGPRGAEYGSAFEEAYEPAEDDLEVEVTFEEPETQVVSKRAPASARNPEPDTDGMDPRLFETSLGLLDAFDEYGDYRPQAGRSEPQAPLPSPRATAPGAEQSEPEADEAQAPAKSAPSAQSNLRLTRPKPSLGKPKHP